MKLKKEFITHETRTETLLVPTGGAGWAGLVRGNRSLGAVLTLLKSDTTEEGLIAALQARFDAPEAVIAADVQKALTALRLFLKRCRAAARQLWKAGRKA